MLGRIAMRVARGLSSEVGIRQQSRQSMMPLATNAVPSAGLASRLAHSLHPPLFKNITCGMRRLVPNRVARDGPGAGSSRSTCTLASMHGQPEEEKAEPGSANRGITEALEAFVPSSKETENGALADAAGTSSSGTSTHAASTPASGGGQQQQQGQQEQKQPSRLDRLKRGVITNFLPIALSTGLGLGVMAPELGAAAAQTSLQTYVVIAIFITSGLQIKRGEAMQALSATGVAKRRGST